MYYLPIYLHVCLLPTCLSASLRPVYQYLSFYLPTCLSVGFPAVLSIYLFIYLSTFCYPAVLSIYLFICLPACLSVSLLPCGPVYLSTCLPTCLSVCYPDVPYIYLSLYLPTYLSVCRLHCLPISLLSIYQSVNLSVYLLLIL